MNYFALAFALILSACSPEKPALSSKDIKSVSFIEDDALQDLYQMLKDTSELFERAGVRYSACSGTLLGMTRHGGFIPWDDDADLVILHEDEPKLDHLQKAFAVLGYSIILDPLDSSVYRISKQGNPPAFRKGLTFPFIDVATVALNKKTKEVKYVNWRMLSYFPDEWFTEDSFFPLKKRAFGPIQLYSPKDPEWFLTHYYGPNWKNEGKIVPRHHKPRHKETFTINFKKHPEFLDPGLPKKPLQDRVKDLPKELF
jgi:lipopolysaccharide cholinephosphotransferase